jgi:propane monooxygenase small subunit
MQQTAFVEQGLWIAVASSARAALSDTLTHFMAFQAGFKQREAQAVVLYAMDLETDHGEFSMDASRTSWMDDAPWQPVRAYVEQLNTLTDWAEVLVAGNLCFDALVGVLLRRELLERGGANNHDTVTPVVFNVAQMEFLQIARFTTAFVDFATSSPEHGDANRAVVQGWVDEWLPRAREAAAALEPLFASQPNGAGFAAALERVEGELGETLRELGLRDATEVAA